MPMSRRTLLKAAVAAVGTVTTSDWLAACASPGSATSTSISHLSFPASFRWGCATSSYQIEGAVKEDGRGESIWDRFSHTPGKTKQGATGDIACDHYHHYAQDIDLMQQLGMQTYRFSIAWPRIFPTGSGTVNQAGIDFYKRLVDGLLKRNIQPMATLFHWDLPQALQDQGGWENRDVAQRFAEYADALFDALGDIVPGWLTLNEPKTVVDVGYIYGTHAPGFTDPKRAYIAMHHMLLGHGLATQAFHARGLSGKQIGIALNLSPVYPAPGEKNAQEAVTLRDGYENRLYLDPVLHGAYPKDVLADMVSRGFDASVIQPGDEAIIGQPINLLGVNYYNPVYMTATGASVQVEPTSLATWQQIYPAGLSDMLTRIKHDYGDIAISITENGIPGIDPPTDGTPLDDPQRVEFVRAHIEAMGQAMAAGVRVESYHLWSFLDNFEWAEGYTQRWGIVSVDYTNQVRTPKRSALWYQQFIAEQQKQK